MPKPNKEIEFARSSVADESGKVFFFKGGVYRAIYSKKYADMYKELLESSWINEIYHAGLIETEITDDVKLEGANLILKHRKLSYFAHPVEMTSQMHWESASTLLRVGIELIKHGYILKDSHPWNLMVDRGRFKFIDFGSIIKARLLPSYWLDEFFKYYIVPIWIANHGFVEYAKEYRRQHEFGFGIRLFEEKWLKATLFNSVYRLSKYIDRPDKLFNSLNDWLVRHVPSKAIEGTWGSYPQYAVSNNPLDPVLPKQKIVFNLLREIKPNSVLDCAANKGYYSEMAAMMGASVISFDCEENCVNECNELAKRTNLDITSVLMDFKNPTPPFAIGLLFGSSFQRLKSEIVIALGLVHHVCIRQHLPVEVFCEICVNYSINGIIFEYVDPSDIHIASWNIPAAHNYSLDNFIEIFAAKHMVVDSIFDVKEDGLNRNIVYLKRHSE